MLYHTTCHLKMGTFLWLHGFARVGSPNTGRGYYFFHLLSSPLIQIRIIFEYIDPDFKELANEYK